MLNNFSHNMLTNAMILNINKRLNRISSDETQDDYIYNINKIKCEPSDHKSEALNLHKEVSNNMLDLGFLGGLTGDSVTINSSNTQNYVAFRTQDGYITFTYEGDNRLNEGEVFGNVEKLIMLTSKQHQDTLEMMNTCEWDKSVDFVNGEFVKIEKYTPEEKAVKLAEMARQEELAFFNKEKNIALAITEDYNLQLENVKDNDIAEVGNYMKSIKPKSPDTPMILMAMPLVQRPIIMDEYEAREINDNGWY
ncbi:MAG: hypothetical protein ACRC23_01655 [Aeromonas jandaei]